MHPFLLEAEPCVVGLRVLHAFRIWTTEGSVSPRLRLDPNKVLNLFSTLKLDIEILAGDSAKRFVTATEAFLDVWEGNLANFKGMKIDVDPLLLHAKDEATRREIYRLLSRVHEIGTTLTELAP